MASAKTIAPCRRQLKEVGDKAELNCQQESGAQPNGEANRCGKLEKAQRPTKKLLTLGTHFYDDLCSVAQEQEVARTRGRRGGPNLISGEERTSYII
jgi:hypothetical protein